MRGEPFLPAGSARASSGTGVVPRISGKSESQTIAAKIAAVAPQVHHL
jgi:hypothetical protein